MKDTRRVRVLATVLATLAATIAVGVQATPAHAQKLQESKRYESLGYTIRKVTGSDPTTHQAITDPNCPTYPGVRRWSKVWAAAYGGDEYLHTMLRAQFHTTYNRSVADAKLGYQNAGITPSCAELEKYTNADEVTARFFASCGFATNKPARWCALVGNNLNDPAVNPALYARCSGPAPNGNFWPSQYHDWHNLKDSVGDAAHLYNVDVLAQLSNWFKSVGLSLNMPVYIDDLTVVGGVRNYDQDSGQPTSGDNPFYGYGRTATPNMLNLVAIWYDYAAQSLGRDPYTNPVAAHQAVDNAIAAGQVVKGSGFTRAQLYSQIVCPSSPLVSDVVDPGGDATNAAIGQDLSGWVTAETGKSLCDNILKIAAYKDAWGLVCQNNLVGQVFGAIDNGTCMNRPNPVAAVFQMDLGCNRDIHLARLFSKVKDFLGG